MLLTDVVYRLRLPALVAVTCFALAGVAVAEHPKAPGVAGIATAHPAATRAGHEMLERGGNAFDAAVAIAGVLGVVEPFASGLGGGSFWLLHVAGEDRDVFVDARETAPGAATPDIYLDDEGEPIPRATFDGPLAAGIPGQAAGIVHVAEKFGRLPLEETLAPAIELAEKGFPAYERMLRGLRFRRRATDRSPAFKAVYYPGGTAVEASDTVVQRDLAMTLRRLASRGIDGFYRGRTAELLVEGVRAAGGIWTLDDLAGYRVAEREPIRAAYRGTKIVSAPPPSSGGIVIANVLNLLSGYNLAELDAVTRKHLVIESLRRAYRDRAQYLGDPAFAEIPVERLTHPYYAAGQRVSIRTDRATPSSALSGIWPAGRKGTNTTHFSVLDAQGNRVAATLTINTWYGSGFMVPGTGVLLNNEMDDFSVKPGVPNGFDLIGAEANAVAPGKRPLSSMSPTFLESDRGVAILGTPGGSRIITMVLRSALAWIDGAGADEMVAMKRFHHQFFPDRVEFEAGAFTPDEIAALESRGHKLAESRRQFGNMNVVTWDFAADSVDAATDPRGVGEGRVY